MNKIPRRQNGANREYAVWRKSTYSNPSGSCVEVAEHAHSMVIRGFIHIRDSKNPRGGVLEFTEKEWSAFVAGVKDGEFDLIQS